VTDKRKKNPPDTHLFSGERNLAHGAPYRWPPGVSGNPGGRPKTAVLSQACREKLGELVPDDEHNRTYAQLIADMLGEKAIHGNMDAAAELADRGEGRPRQDVEVNGRGDPLAELLEEFKKAHERGYIPPQTEELQ
jgi:Family of unknown function (DUF5681)